MKNNNSKFILSVPGEVAYNYNIRSKGLNVSNEFETTDALLQYLYEVDKNQFDEHKDDKANLFLDFYFSYFNIDYVNQANWNSFVSTFNIETPRNNDFYNFESPNDKNKDIEPIELLKNCIKDSGIDQRKVNNVSKLLLNKDNEYIHITTDYFCDTTTDMLVAVINHLFKYKPKAIIKKCENCGKLFVPKHTTAKYCNRISPQFENKTCKEAMDIIKKEEALNDPAKLLYKNIYDTLYSSYKNKKTKDNKKTLDNFRKENVVMKAKYQLKEISQKEYIEWLKSHYKNK